MKLHLVLLASVFNLSSGFMAELKGPLAKDEACTGAEYADFKKCVEMGAATDSNLAGVAIDLEDEAFVNRGGERHMNMCAGCRGNEPRGTFCFTMCNGNGRRLEAGTDTPNVRRAQKEVSGVFTGGIYIGGNDETNLILKTITECLEDLSSNHPCLGSINTMTLTVTL
jgi:hypothetical protein